MTPIEPICVSNLLRLARAYAAIRDVSLVTVGRYFHGTGHFFEKLETGDITLNVPTYDKIMAKFRDQWPEGHQFPKIRSPMKTKSR